MNKEYRVLTAIEHPFNEELVTLKMVPGAYLTKTVPKQEVNAKLILDFYRDCLDILAEQVAKDIIKIRDEMKGVRR